MPPDHMLRSIDRFVDLGDVRERLKPLYGNPGRRFIDPGMMLRMLIGHADVQDNSLLARRRMFGRLILMALLYDSLYLQARASHPKCDSMLRGFSDFPVTRLPTSSP
jgi:hypothetical protein